VTFDGVARLCAAAMGKDPSRVELVHYNPKDLDFGKKKAFPFRPQHFFTSIENAIRDLDWLPDYDNLEGLRDSYQNDFVIKQREGKLKNDFETDDIVLAAAKRDTRVPTLA